MSKIRLITISKSLISVCLLLTISCSSEKNVNPTDCLITSPQPTSKVSNPYYSNLNPNSLYLDHNWSFSKNLNLHHINSQITNNNIDITMTTEVVKKDADNYNHYKCTFIITKNEFDDFVNLTKTELICPVETLEKNSTCNLPSSANLSQNIQSDVKYLPSYLTFIEKNVSSTVDLSEHSYEYDYFCNKSSSIKIQDKIELIINKNIELEKNCSLLN